VCTHFHTYIHTYIHTYTYIYIYIYFHLESFTLNHTQKVDCNMRKLWIIISVFFLCILRGENRAKRQNNNLITSGSLVFHCLSLSLPSFPTPHLLIQVINRSIMVKKELGKQNLHEKWIMLSINYIFQQIRRTK
jgi:hypothetical protein